MNHVKKLYINYLNYRLKSLETRTDNLKNKKMSKILKSYHKNFEEYRMSRKHLVSCILTCILTTPCILLKFIQLLNTTSKVDIGLLSACSVVASYIVVFGLFYTVQLLIIQFVVKNKYNFSIPTATKEWKRNCDSKITLYVSIPSSSKSKISIYDNSTIDSKSLVEAVKISTDENGLLYVLSNMYFNTFKPVGAIHYSVSKKYRKKELHALYSCSRLENKMMKMSNSILESYKQSSVNLKLTSS